MYSFSFNTNILQFKYIERENTKKKTFLNHKTQKLFLIKQKVLFLSFIVRSEKSWEFPNKRNCVISICAQSTRCLKKGLAFIYTVFTSNADNKLMGFSIF